MTSDIPVGSIFKMRLRNQWTWWQLIDFQGQLAYMGVGKQPVPAGTIVYSCVWKGEHLTVRKTYPLKKDLGFKPLDSPWFPDACERFEVK